ncbi:chorismate mutase [Chitinibacter bivalviorum]|uniref:chorismate mutase n=1 Tax=Chitinibacter bivalviorum TaxID=2739434 RepID=A0A7H9BLE4_9NEIS|nr:chorismate mutase [Chitinibacter bivalviorum]QLG89500.1 chorismate mutase [Chitinibacter bivalviorum]
MSVPAELLALREQIDALDQQLFSVLAERFKVTAQVGQLKKQYQLPAQDVTRETQQLEKTAARAAQAGLDPEFAQRLQRLILDEVVLQHQRC